MRLDNVLMPILMPEQSARHHRELFLIRKLGCLNNRLASHWIDRDGFFEKHMFPGINRRSVMNRPETGWRRQNHQIDSRIQHFLVRIQPHEAFVVRHLVLRADLGHILP